MGSRRKRSLRRTPKRFQLRLPFSRSSDLMVRPTRKLQGQGVKLDEGAANAQ